VPAVIFLSGGCRECATLSMRSNVRVVVLLFLRFVSIRSLLFFFASFVFLVSLSCAFWLCVSADSVRRQRRRTTKREKMSDEIENGKR